MHRRATRWLIAVLLASSAACYAGAKEELQAAAQKLADAPNYSWTQTTENGGGAGGGWPTA